MYGSKFCESDVIIHVIVSVIILVTNKARGAREKVYVKPLKVNALFYYMPYFIGIPQAILNFTVFTTVILITKHPLLGFDTFSLLLKPFLDWKRSFLPW